MLKSYQVTMYCTTNQYKPISTIVKIEQEREEDNLLLDKEKKQEIINKGIVKICQKKYWTMREVKRYNYTRVKAREYKQE
jgi:hypothetical protein